jgi:hypothetical protein
MRCFCCDSRESTYDKFTGRFYCQDCFSVSMETLREMTQEEDTEEDFDDEEDS